LPSLPPPGRGGVRLKQEASGAYLCEGSSLRAAARSNFIEHGSSENVGGSVVAAINRSSHEDLAATAKEYSSVPWKACTGSSGLSTTPAATSARSMEHGGRPTS